MYRLINPVNDAVIYVGEADPLQEARRPVVHPCKLTRIIRSLWRNGMQPRREEVDTPYREEEEEKTDHAENTRRD